MRLRVAGLLVMLAVVVFSWILTCAAWQYDRVAEGVRPLDPRDFDRLTLVTLGTAGMAEDHNRRGTSVAAGLDDEVVLIDAGRGLAEGLRAAAIPVDQPDTLLITALVPENVVGLDAWIAAAWLAGRREPIRVIGPPGTAAVANAAREVVAAGVTARSEALHGEAASPRVEVQEVGAAWQGETGGLVLEGTPRSGGPVPALAWKVRGGERTAVVGSFGWDLEALEQIARGANLLIHDAARIPTAEEVLELGLELDSDLLEREAAHLTEYPEVGNLARRAEVPVLVLVRLRPPPVLDLQVTTEISDFYDGRVVVAEDGDEFTP